MTYRIAPSMLSADFGRLKEEVQAIEAAGADLLHFDVMDNHYVPNLTVGPMVCKALRPHIRMPIDVHLMVSPVDSLAVAFADAGADIITFHPEASPHVDRTLQLIRSRGCKAGLVFNPATPLSWLDYTLDQLDIVLLMSVNPGFGGQSFIPGTLAKLRDARQRIDAEKARSGVTSGWRSMVASRSTTLPRSPLQGPIPSWPVRRFSARLIRTGGTMES